MRTNLDTFVKLSVCVAGLLRYWLLTSEYVEVFSNRVELATPLNSWKRLMEGVYLYNQGIDPYDGDMFHETPLVLIFFHQIIYKFPQLKIIPIMFTVVDVMTAIFLYFTTKRFMDILKQRQDNEAKDYAKDCDSLIIDKDDFVIAPVYVLVAYLFNPYSVLNCVAMTTTVLSNFFLSVSLFSMVRGYRILCCISIALCSHVSLYPAVLIVPASIFIHSTLKGCAKCCYIKTLTVFVLAWGSLILISASIMDGSYNFLENTYGFILNVPDLKPNVGLFWYFFTEMFEHFRLLFICSFQINALLLYVIPLTFRFHKEPLLLATTLISLSTVFKSYPSLGDVAFYMALLPMWKHLFSYMQQKFVVGCFLLVTSALGPTFWHLWIYSRSANANFFFGVTLAFASAQIFLITDLLFAYIKREFALVHGTSREIDGQPAKLVLR